MSDHEPSARVNRVGLTRKDYRGRKTTLCPGCGHNTIFERIIDVADALSLQPAHVIKLSGIGCSSKSPAFFLNRSHGFNGLHGRMPSQATGALLANHTLTAIGISGDGDTGNIGLGQFKHMVRRNVPVVYIIENNGVYGLTKGQFSATADVGQRTKYAGLNELPPIDLCLEAVIADCGFVARSFAGDKDQVKALLQAALSHRGTAVLDIISPCVAFNDGPESTKSYEWGMRHHKQGIISDPSFIPAYEEIPADYAPGTTVDVTMHDGSVVRLTKLEHAYDPTDRFAALRRLEEAHQRQEFITGLLYINEDRPSFLELARLPKTPLARLSDDALRPSPEALETLIDALK
jgi:2-oxoglutarate ferredoxin oxidoreductase subunit beta